jgi:hypothetical protein
VFPAPETLARDQTGQIGNSRSPTDGQIDARNAVDERYERIFHWKTMRLDRIDKLEHRSDKSH